MTDGHEEPLLVGSRGWSRILIPATFFSLGAESSVTLSTVTLAAAYYKDTLGDSIVAALITSHVSVQLVVMLAILVAIRDVSQLTLHTSATVVSCAALYAALFNAFMLGCVLCDHPVSGSVLYPLVAVNGGATGLVQSLSSRMGGDLPTTKRTSVGSLQLVGVSFAQWVPGLIQACLLPLALQPGHEREASRLGAILSLGAATLLCLGALSTLQLTLRVCAADIEAKANDPDTEEIRCKTIGLVCRRPNGKGLQFIWEKRIVVLAPMVLLLVSAEAMFTFLIVISPRIPIATAADGMAFWETYQVTLLIMAANSAPRHPIPLKVSAPRAAAGSRPLLARAMRPFSRMRGHRFVAQPSPSSGAPSGSKTRRRAAVSTRASCCGGASRHSPPCSRSPTGAAGFRCTRRTRCACTRALHSSTASRLCC